MKVAGILCMKTSVDGVITRNMLGKKICETSNLDEVSWFQVRCGNSACHVRCFEMYPFPTNGDYSPERNLRLHPCLATNKNATALIAGADPEFRSKGVLDLKIRSLAKRATKFHPHRIWTGIWPEIRGHIAIYFNTDIFGSLRDGGEGSMPIRVLCWWAFTHKF